MGAAHSDCPERPSPPGRVIIKRSPFPVTDLKEAESSVHLEPDFSGVAAACLKRWQVRARMSPAGVLLRGDVGCMCGFLFLF